MTLPIPPAVLYAGLVGVFLSLIVATAQQRWQLRVFVLLALRLAIGWHFLFEGLHKIHSHVIGPTETNRPFTSEPYFTAAEGPLGAYMRKHYLGDPESRYRDRVLQSKPMSKEEFAKLSKDEKVALCPENVANDLKEQATKRLPEAHRDVDEAKVAFNALPDGPDDASKK